jgi:cellulose synthase operon protein C
LVACYDAEDGRLLWRQFVCAADTPSRGVLHETTHNLLTLNGDTLYYNTNLGAVAALTAHDGRVQWVSLYPRVLRGDLFSPPPHWSRDLNPCLFDRGRLLVAPADSPRILALEAETGQLLWQSGPEVEDVVHLLGVAGNCLIASGQKLYWIGLEGEDRGHVRHVWPDGPERPGYGRGILAGGLVYFPTRETIYLFDQLTGQLRKQMPLVPRGLSGGNLLIAGDRLLIATGEELVALGPPAAQPGKPSGGAGENRAQLQGIVAGTALGSAPVHPLHSATPHAPLLFHN